MFSITIEVTAEGEERFLSFADRSPATWADDEAREHRMVVEVRGPSGVLYTADGRPLAQLMREARHPGQLELIDAPVRHPAASEEHRK